MYLRQIPPQGLTGFVVIAAKRLGVWGVAHSHHSSLSPPQATGMNRLSLLQFSSRPHSLTLHCSSAHYIKHVLCLSGESGNSSLEQMNRTTGAALQIWPWKHDLTWHPESWGEKATELLAACSRSGSSPSSSHRSTTHTGNTTQNPVKLLNKEGGTSMSQALVATLNRYANAKWLLEHGNGNKMSVFTTDFGNP